VIVPVELPAFGIRAGENTKLVSVGGCMDRDAGLSNPPRVATMLRSVRVATGLVVTEKSWSVAFGGTRTLSGTVTAVVSVLRSATK
jgi:hypothetical protein